jgi:peptide/nickel transport system substrate-binding protein
MKKPRALAVAALTTLLALVACNANPAQQPDGAGSTGSTTKGGTLTILSPATEVSFDPAKSQSLATLTHGLVLRRLTTWEVQPGQPARVVPDLATDTGQTSDGGKTWTYTIKDGLKYADGSPITSADIKYGIERSFAPELAGGLGYHKTLLVGGADYSGPYSGAELASVKTPDARTIVFELNVPYGDWPSIASMPAFAPVPKAKDDPKTYGSNPVASGPYEVESFQQGRAVTLARNPNWDPQTDRVRTAGPDKIVLELGQDATVAAQRLIADSGDDKNAIAGSFVPPAQLVQIERNATAKERLVTSEAGGLYYLAMNTQRGPLRDLKVRQAIQYAVDKKAYQVASGGPIGGVLARNSSPRASPAGWSTTSTRPARPAMSPGPGSFLPGPAGPVWT